MAALYVTEYASTGQIPGAQMTQEPALAAYSVAITGSSTQSQAFNPLTRHIEIHCDVICSVDIGVNPVAVPTARRMPANQLIYRGVPQGGNYRIAVITNT